MRNSKLNSLVKLLAKDTITNKLTEMSTKPSMPLVDLLIGFLKELFKEFKIREFVGLVGLSLLFALWKDFTKSTLENWSASLSNNLFLVNLNLTDVMEDGLKLPLLTQLPTD